MSLGVTPTSTKKNNSNHCHLRDACLKEGLNTDQIYIYIYLARNDQHESGQTWGRCVHIMAVFAFRKSQMSVHV